MKLIIYMPAMNEEENIQSVINLLPQTMAGIDQIEYLVVDDGSTDRTLDVLQQLRSNELTFKEAAAKSGDLGASGWFDVLDGHKSRQAWNKGFTGKGVHPLHFHHHTYASYIGGCIAWAGAHHHEVIIFVIQAGFFGGAGIVGDRRIYQYLGKGIQALDNLIS